MLVETVELENSELRGRGVGVVCVDSSDFEAGVTTLASFVGLGGFSSFAVLT